MLLDFSDSSFASGPADGKNCIISHCTDGEKYQSCSLHESVLQ